METPHLFKIDDDVQVWLDPDGGISIKAVDPHGDPVALSPSQAEALIAALQSLVQAEGLE